MLTIVTILSAALLQDPAAEANPLAPRLLEPMDLFQLEGVRSPAVSPDGGKVLYSRVGYDVMTDRDRGELWLYDVMTGDRRPLVDRVGAAVWSPSGEHIAYLAAAGDDGAEVFVRWMDDGTTRQVTRLPKSPGSLSWSPDGTRLAFTMDVERKSEPFVQLPSAPKGAKWAPAPKVIERFGYRGDGAGYLENTDTQIFVVEAMGGTPRQLTAGPKDHEGPLVWADEGTLLFSANLRDDRRDHPSDSEVWSLDVASGALTPLTQREGPDGAPVIDEATGAMYWTGFDDRRLGHQRTNLYRRAPGTSESELVALDLDRSVGDLHADGGTIYFGFASEGVSRIGTTNGVSAKVLPYSLHGMGSGRPYSGGEFDVRGGTLAFVGGDPTWPGELHVVTNGESVQVTDVNADLKQLVRLGQVKEQWTLSPAEWKLSPPGNRLVQSWIVTPPDFDPGKTYPMVLEIHGGPFAAYGPQFSFELQLMAARGYVVVYGNPRGSTSYGPSFANEIHHAYPGQDYDDLMSMVDGALAKGSIDPKRLYVTGGSGGGVLTAWIVGKTDRFAAAVVAKPVINWISFALTADAYDFFWQYWFPAKPWDDPQHYWSRSPLSLVGNVTTPTMLLTGESDFRTPISESEQYYQALKIRGVETAFVRIPEASHGIGRRPSQLIAKVLHILAWFERDRS